jgi:hypothetical protein
MVRVEPLGRRVTEVLQVTRLAAAAALEALVRAATRAWEEARAMRWVEPQVRAVRVEMKRAAREAVATTLEVMAALGVWEGPEEV